MYIYIHEFEKILHVRLVQVSGRRENTTLCKENNQTMLPSTMARTL